MVGKCANPECKATFRYLHEGKLFVIDPLHPLTYKPRAQGKQWRLNHLWLCEDCSRTMTVAYTGGENVRVLPISPNRGNTAAAPLAAA
ncbi:MAG: hypothetical protein ACE14M_12340 [Terriglobales bacterium]